MTDHLEPYRRMARSIRFVPPLWNIERLYRKFTEPMPASSSEVAHTPHAVAPAQPASEPDPGPSINPNEHIANLVHEAVSQPTALPLTYQIPENIGDRIGKLSTTKQQPILLQQPKIPQPDPNWVPPAASAATIQEAAEPVLEKSGLNGSSNGTASGATDQNGTTAKDAVPAVAVTETPAVLDIATVTVAQPPETVVAVTEAAVTETEEAIVEAATAVETVAAETITAVATAEESVVEESTEEAVEEEPVAVVAAEAVVVEPVAEATSTETIETTQAETVADPTLPPPPVESTSEPANSITPIGATVEPTAAEAVQPTSTNGTVTLSCPACGSIEIRKNGRRGIKQKYLCKDCGRQFTGSGRATAIAFDAAPKPAKGKRKR